MIVIDCQDLSADERIALASAVSDELAGRALALIKGESLVLDQLGEGSIEAERVDGIVRKFVSRRRDAAHYSVEREGDKIVVHSADPVAARRSRRQNELPPNLMKCPFCFFVTPYEEVYNVHVRAHGAGVL